jgi:hypothetical protein
MGVTIERAQVLLASWPREAEYMLIERWELMGDFWRAVADTRRVWGETWGRDVAATQLRIDGEEQEKTKWNKLQAASAHSQQQRLY